MLEKVNGFSKSHFAKKKFPDFITNFKRNWCTDLIKFWASCSIITGRAANITVFINTTTPPPFPQQQCSFCVMCFTTEKLKLNLWSLMGCLIFDERGDQSLEDVVSRVLEFRISGIFIVLFPTATTRIYPCMYVQTSYQSRQDSNCGSMHSKQR